MIIKEMYGRNADQRRPSFALPMAVEGIFCRLSLFLHRAPYKKRDKLRPHDDTFSFLDGFWVLAVRSLRSDGGLFALCYAA